MRTVESHLSHIYRKLGVRSRTELTHRLIAADESPNAADEAAKVQWFPRFLASRPAVPSTGIVNTPKGST